MVVVFRAVRPEEAEAFAVFNRQIEPIHRLHAVIYCADWWQAMTSAWTERYRITQVRRGNQLQSVVPMRQNARHMTRHVPRLRWLPWAREDMRSISRVVRAHHAVDDMLGGRGTENHRVGFSKTT